MAFGGRFLGAQGITVVGTLLVVGLLGASNVFDAYKDVYRGYRYDQEMRERFDRLQAHRGNTAADVTVGSISRAPRTLFATGFVTDPRNFGNACAAEYFGVRSITLGVPAK